MLNFTELPQYFCVNVRICSHPRKNQYWPKSGSNSQLTRKETGVQQIQIEYSKFVLCFQSASERDWWNKNVVWCLSKGGSDSTIVVDSCDAAEESGFVGKKKNVDIGTNPRERKKNLNQRGEVPHIARFCTWICGHILRIMRNPELGLPAGELLY